MVMPGLHYAGNNGISQSDINFNRFTMQYSWIEFRNRPDNSSGINDEKRNIY